MSARLAIVSVMTDIFMLMARVGIALLQVPQQCPVDFLYTPGHRFPVGRGMRERELRRVNVLATCRHVAKTGEIHALLRRTFEVVDDTIDLADGEAGSPANPVDVLVFQQR